jgi:putative molybdopterin biosynthesis protein
VYRRGDPRFEHCSIEEIIATVRPSPHPASGIPHPASSPAMVNRNQGSGTRILIDQLLGGARPGGYAIQPTTHSAVAAAVAQGRADWGLAIESVARANGLGFVAYREEHYDFVIPKTHRDRPAIQAFADLLAEPSTKKHLTQLGFRIS